MPDPVPTNKASWEDQSKALRCKSIHDYQLSSSGSNIDTQQFLLLRTIWKQNFTSSLSQDGAHWISHNYCNQAKQLLKIEGANHGWEEFLKATAYSAETLIQQTYSGLSTFALVRYHQLQSQGLESEGNGNPKVDFSSPIASRTRAQTKRIPEPTTPTPAPVTALTPSSLSTSPVAGLAEGLEAMQMRDSPCTPPSPESPEDYSSPFVYTMIKDVQDEQIVNTALIEYLNGLAIHYKQIKADWTLHRLALTCRNNQAKKSYEARVDGYLKRRSDGQPLVILEVKPCKRKKNQAQIRMQESAQMAAWISQYPPSIKGRSRRLLISQDRHEIFLTFAVFNTDYVDYIRHKTNDVHAVSFLEMNEYGPYDVGAKEDMRRLGELVLGYMLEAM
ncbi:hypothetical protein F4824DRAFT_454009 [Ustulina deusta]|nr:hypothetical protein F4824DRAFT_454009 [Ustulina deusta]